MFLFLEMAFSFHFFYLVNMQHSLPQLLVETADEIEDWNATWGWGDH